MTTRLMRIVAALSLLLFVGAAQSAETYQDAIAAHERGDDKLAISIMRPLAEAGDVAAQYNMGLSYANATGVENDDKQAVAWFRKSSASGYAQAQLLLGIMYSYGRGVDKDRKEATHWFALAADQGNANAQFYLAVNYMEGAGVGRDEAKAIDLLQKSADHGVVNAQISLGASFADGKGVPKDLVSAYMWLTVAAGGMPAGRARELAYGLRDQVAGGLNAQQKSEAEQRAKNWRPPAPAAVR